MERSVAREYLEALIIAAIFLRFTNTFIIQTFYIPSGSMEETLLIGDHLFVNRFIYGPAATDLEREILPLRDVQRGDIVVFRSPENPQMDVVKRCVGLPGDTIDVVDKRLFINGKEVDDSLYAIHRDPNVYSAGLSLSEQGVRRDNFGPEQVPAGKYFCMGDNRDYSYDSRFWGTLPRHLIKGRSLFIYWSNGAQAPENPRQGYGGKLRDLLRTAAGFFSNTRWERTFQLIR
jgi:signal peptidase I